MKCDVLGNAHSLPICEMDFEVEISNMRACMSRWRMNHWCGGIRNTRLNSFLNEVSDRLQSAASSSI